MKENNCNKMETLNKCIEVAERILTRVLLLICTFGLITVYRGQKEILELEKQLRLQEAQYTRIDYEIMNEKIMIENSAARSFNYTNVTENIELETVEPEKRVFFTGEVVIEEKVIEQKKSRSADVELLAQLMYAEEGVYLSKMDENLAKVERVHKLAGSVVLHRTYGNFMGATTIRETIFMDGQYASQTRSKVTSGQDVPEIVYTWAEELLRDGPIGPSNLVFQAQFEQGNETYEKIWNQYFCLGSFM